MLFFRIFQHLLPSGKPWLITLDKTLKNFFLGLSTFLGDVKIYADQVFQDIDPLLTRQLDLWESNFALRGFGLNEEERRQRLLGKWREEGGQSPAYIQQTLRAAGFDVYVHEWWEPNSRMAGGSVNMDVVPVARNPFDYIYDGVAGDRLLSYDGALDMIDGGVEAFDGNVERPSGLPLVNKVEITKEALISDGIAMDGSDDSVDGGIEIFYEMREYAMPTTTDTYSYYLYIGGEVFPEKAFVPNNRREEFEGIMFKNMSD